MAARQTFNLFSESSNLSGPTLSDKQKRQLAIMDISTRINRKLERLDADKAILTHIATVVKDKGFECSDWVIHCSDGYVTISHNIFLSPESTLPETKAALKLARVELSKLFTALVGYRGMLVWEDDSTNGTKTWKLQAKGGDKVFQLSDRTELNFNILTVSINVHDDRCKMERVEKTVEAWEYDCSNGLLPQL